MGLGLIPAYAFSYNFGFTSGIYLMLTYSICASIGKLTAGMFAEFLGRYNTLLFTSIITLFIMIILWLPFGSRSLPILYIVIAFVGFGSGSFTSLITACVGRICDSKGDIERLGRWIASMDRVVAGVTLVAMPLSASLLQNYGGAAMIGFAVGILALSILVLSGRCWAT